MPLTLTPRVPSDYATTRDALHRVAAHVLARGRFAVTGRFGLRVTPGGFGTPLFGPPDAEDSLRISGTTLVREVRGADGPRSWVVPLAGATLAEVASAVGVALDPDFSVGTDTPALGDPSAPLSVDPASAAVMADFLAVGAAALDRVLATLGPGAAPVVAQLWPEHFDLGVDVGVGGVRANVGASVGDHYHATPYAYVGPWGPERPGDPAFWNVGFGALLGYPDVAAAPDPVGAVHDFVLRGLGLLGA